MKSEATKLPEGFDNLSPGTAATKSFERNAVISEESTVQTLPDTIPQRTTLRQLICPSHALPVVSRSLQWTVSDLPRLDTICSPAYEAMREMNGGASVARMPILRRLRAAKTPNIVPIARHLAHLIEL